MHFSVEWVSVMHEVAEGFTFNWAKMLSDNLAKGIVEYKTAKSKGQPAPFYMSTYIMDAICFMTPFPLMDLCPSHITLLLKAPAGTLPLT